MRSVYGTWKRGAVVHAVGYDGKYLCGRKQGYNSTECADGTEWVDCVKCKKALTKKAPSWLPTADELKSLEDSYKHLQSVLKAINGDKSTCAVDGLPKGLHIYLTSWVIPGMERMLEKYEMIKVEK